MTTATWVSYVRVSTDEQAQEGVSLAAQTASCGHLIAATTGGRGLVEVVEDAGYSGKNLRRPGAERVLDMIDRGAIAGVVVWRLDRLTRSLRDLIDLVERCDRQGVALVSVTEQISTQGPMGRFVLHLLGAVAQLERETTAARVKAAMTHVRMQGLYAGGRIPVGVVASGERGQRRLARSAVHGDDVAAIWPGVISGWTLGQVIVHLESKGVPTATGRRWSRQLVHKLLRSQRAIGPLVDAETQRAAIAALDRRATPTRSGEAPERRASCSDRVWRLASIARCGTCGGPLTGFQAKGRHGGRYPYLRCVRKNKSRECAAQDLPAAAWEDATVVCLANALRPGGEAAAQLVELISQRRKATVEHEPRAVALEGRQRELRAQIDRVVGLVAGGDVVAAAARPMLVRLQGELETVDRDLSVIQAELAAAAMGEHESALILEALGRAAADLASQPVERQAEVLAALVQSATLAPGPDGRGSIDLVVWIPGSVNEAAQGFALGRVFVEQGRRMGKPSGTSGFSIPVAFQVEVRKRLNGARSVSVAGPAKPE